MAHKGKLDSQTCFFIGKCIALGLALILSEIFSYDLFGAMLNAFVYMITIAYDMIVAICTLWKKEFKVYDSKEKVVVSTFGTINFIVFLALLALSIYCGITGDREVADIHKIAVIIILFICTVMSLTSEKMVSRYTNKVQKARAANAIGESDTNVAEEADANEEEADAEAV